MRYHHFQLTDEAVLVLSEVVKSIIFGLESNPQTEVERRFVEVLHELDEELDRARNNPEPVKSEP